MFDYDLLVIGAGSGGVRAARMAASFGAKVAVVEAGPLGGTCVNVGCVPKKLLMYGSTFSEAYRDAVGFGWQEAQPSFDWGKLIANKNAEILRLNGIYNGILTGAGVEVIHGFGRFDDAHTVDVDGKKITAERVLIAVGGTPFIPDIPGREHIISSDDVFYLDELPESIIIVGGGYIAAEFASIFNGFGAETTLMYRGPQFLRGFDDDIRQFVGAEMQKKGVDLQFDQQISAVEKHADGYQVILADGQRRNADCVFYATGRQPNIDRLGLENTQVSLTDAGYILVDDHFQTDQPGVYALGDVTGGMELTPVALAEGMVLAKNLYNGESNQVDYDNIATAVFTQPNIATVGLTEAQARQKYDEVEVFRSEFRSMKHSLGDNQERTLMKLLVDKASDHVVGAHMVGSEAGEIIQGLAVAIKAGATKAVFDQTIGIHPTIAEEFVTMRSPVS